MPIEYEHMDVLQNIEFAIVTAFHEDDELLDYDVEEVLDILIGHYRREQIGLPSKGHTFSPRAAVLHSGVRDICEWRLGKGEGEGEGESGVVSIDVMLLCLKRLKKSLERWNSVGGRQGYLRYIEQFIQ
jgi:hypothetical protein